MSYCRFSEGDIYLYATTEGALVCQMCSLAPKVKSLFTTGGKFLRKQIPPCAKCGGAGCDACMLHGSTRLESLEAALAHVQAHRQAGDHVPLAVDERLRREIAASKHQSQ